MGTFSKRLVDGPGAFLCHFRWYQDEVETEKRGKRREKTARWVRSGLRYQGSSAGERERCWTKSTVKLSNGYGVTALLFGLTGTSSCSCNALEFCVTRAEDPVECVASNMCSLVKLGYGLRCALSNALFPLSRDTTDHQTSKRARDCSQPSPQWHPTLVMSPSGLRSHPADP
jgi:hypothetical protein